MNTFLASTYNTRVNIDSYGSATNLIFFHGEQLGALVKFDEYTSRKLESIYGDDYDHYEVHFCVTFINEKNVRNDELIGTNIMDVIAEINRSKKRVDLNLTLECGTQVWESLIQLTIIPQQKHVEFYCEDIIGTEFNENLFVGKTEMISVESYNPTV